MKKQRPRQPRGDRQSNAAPTKMSDDHPAGALQVLSRYAAAIFVVALLAYLLFYFTAPAPDILQDRSGENARLTRIDMLIWLVQQRLPSLWSVWTGGGVGNIGVFARVGLLLAAALELLMALIAGWWLMDVIGVTARLRRLEVFVFSLAVGLCALSLLTLVVGLAGQLQNIFAYTVPLAVMLLFAGRRFRRRVFDVEQVSRPVREPDENRAGRQTRSTDWLPPWLLWLAAPFVLIILAGAMTPPREFDVCEYHLQAPKQWFQQGAITFLPHNIYANMPLGPQILALPAMAFMPGEHAWWWGALVGKLIIAVYVPLTALALFTCGQRFFNTTAGVAAALVYISTAWMAHVSIETYVDGALACYTFLAVYAVMIAIDYVRRPSKAVATDEDQHPTALEGRRTLLLAGLLAGAAVSCKYTGLVFVVAPLLVLVWIAGGLRQSLSRLSLSRLSLSRAGLFLIAVLLACGLWLGKNWVLAGNPTYPLLYNVFGGKTRTPAKDTQWTSAHSPPRDAYGRRYSLRQVGGAIERIAVSSPWISPILLPLAALAFCRRKTRNRLALVGGLFAFILAAWFLLTHRIARFWLPALPLAALAAGAGVTAFDSPWWRRVMIAVLFWGLAWNFLVIAGMLAPPKMLVQLASLKNENPPVHPAHVWLNEHVPPGRAVLLVGDAQPFDLDMPAYYDTCFDDCIFEQLMQGESKDARLAALRERNISYVFVQWSEIDRYRSPGNYGFTDYVTENVFHELVSQGVLQKPLGQNVEQTGQPDRWIGEIYPVAE